MLVATTMLVSFAPLASASNSGTPGTPVLLHDGDLLPDGTTTLQFWNELQKLFKIVSKTPYTEKPMPKGWDPDICTAAQQKLLMVTCYNETSYKSPPVKTAENVVQVEMLDGSEIRVYIDFTNGQKTPRSFQCVINTSVYNRFGDLVNIRTNSTGSNGDVKAGKTQYLYQDLGVDKGDARFVTAKDVKLVDCF
jgi:hypothetical protein